MNLQDYNFTHRYITEEVYKLYRQGYSDEEIQIYFNNKFSLEDISNYIETINYLLI